MMMIVSLETQIDAQKES